jgi:dolichol-phosphate mannosyltransferase
MQLQVVLPTYNEAENLPRMVEALLALRLHDAQLSILVVDDNSPDGTGAIADELAARSGGRVTVLHRQAKDGLARAYLAGIQRALDAGAELVLQMDCDFSHPPRFIPDLLAALPQADLVLGSRYVEGGQLDPHWAWWRKLLSWFANSVYVRTILGIPVHDATGGFRLWRRETLVGMDLARRIHSTGYVFLVELSYVAWKLGYRIREVPIEFPDRAAGDSKMNFAIQLEAARRVFEVRRRHRGLQTGDRAAGG